MCFRCGSLVSLTRLHCAGAACRNLPSFPYSVRTAASPNTTVLWVTCTDDADELPDALCDSGAAAATAAPPQRPLLYYLLHFLALIVVG